MRASALARAVGAAATAAVLLLPSRAAQANGRFPQANQLVSSGSLMILRTTYGILQSTDSAGFHWVCEAAVGYSPALAFDPAIALTGDGVLVGLPDGLSRSTDGCTWSRPAPIFAGTYVVDIALDVSNPQHAVAVTQVLPGTGAQGLFGASPDGGASWTQVSLLPQDFLAETVDLAPSNPSRVYASGVGTFARFGVIVRSDDGGATWSSSSFDMRGAVAPFIAAVDPANADRVFLRLAEDPADRLSVSTNAGVTWADAFTGQGKLLGFALSPDGSQVAVGGPSDGVWVAATADLAFTKVSSIGARCLRWVTQGLYACADQTVDGFALGVSTDGGHTFQGLYHPKELTPLACPAGTNAGDQCPAAWPAVEAVLGLGDSGMAPPRDGGSSPPGAGTSPAPPPADAPVAHGYGCSAGRSDAVGLGALVWLVWVARRRARR
jgi:hypothetical protein